MSDKEPVSPFEFHTSFVAEEGGGGNKIMTCPFCGKEKHFFFSKDTYMWDCKVCLKSGNPIMFVRWLYDLFNNITQTSHTIAEQRGLPVVPIQRLGIKYNEFNDTFIIPTFKHGQISNLYKAFQHYDRDAGKQRWSILATPSLKHQLFNYDETTHDTIWVCEGHWDKPAGDSIVGTRQITCVGVPGAGVWDRDWTKQLAEKDVVFCYDNDNAGQAGFERVILKFIADAPQKPKSISFIKWDEDLPDGFDLNDAYRKWGRGSYSAIEKLIVPYEAPQNTVVVKTTIETVHEDPSCDTFDKVLEKFREAYYTTQDMEQGLAIVLASIYSVKTESEQLWVRLLGPAGSGKTTIAKTVSGSDQVVLKSTFTGLFSGWKDDSDDDASLVPQIAGRTLIVKDADALLRQGNVEKIFSELRDFYDKDSSVQYKNRVQRDYRNIKCTMVLCGTNVLRRADSSFLGERYLDFELRLSSDDRAKVQEKAMQNTINTLASGSSITPEIPVMAGCKGFISHLMNKPLNTVMDQKTITYIMKLANLASFMRTKVDRDMNGRGEITFAPVAESPTRLTGQLTKLCMVLPVVFGTPQPDSRTHKILFKCVRDIIDPSSTRYKICQELIEGYFTMMQLVEMTGIPRSTVIRELDDLRALGMVKEEIVSTNSVGRKARAFTLMDPLKEALILSDEHRN